MYRRCECTGGERERQGITGRRGAGKEELRGGVAVGKDFAKVKMLSSLCVCVCPIRLLVVTKLKKTF